MESSFHLRPATEADIPVILQLILELAIYEKSEDTAKATPELVKENLFEKSYAHALLAISGPASAPEEAIGLALYFFNFSTFTGRPGIYLEDLYIKEEHRSKGIGKALFSELAKVAQEKKCARMDWSVLQWNKPFIKFYENSLGAEWMATRHIEDGIESLKNFSVAKN